MKGRRRGHVRALGRQEFRKVLASGRWPVVVEFGTPWCPGCRRLLYWLQKVCRPYRQRVGLFMVDAERDWALAKEFGIETLPTLLLFQRGQEVARWAGYRSRAALRRQVVPMISLVADRATVPEGTPINEDDVAAVRRLLDKYRGGLADLLADTPVEDRP